MLPKFDSYWVVDHRSIQKTYSSKSIGFRLFWILKAVFILLSYSVFSPASCNAKTVICKRDFCLYKFKSWWKTTLVYLGHAKFFWEKIMSCARHNISCARHNISCARHIISCARHNLYINAWISFSYRLPQIQLFLYVLNWDSSRRR